MNTDLAVANQDESDRCAVADALTSYNAVFAYRAGSSTRLWNVTVC